MGKHLPADQIERYGRQGALFPIPVLTDMEVRFYRSALEEFETMSGGTLKRFGNAHLFLPWAYRLATHPGVVDAVESILGGDILIDGTLVFCKYPHDPAYVSWHQDSVYSNWHLSPTVSAWIALSPSTSQSGCMRVIKGSHQRGVLAHEEVRDQNNLLRRGERIGVAVDESEAIDLDLRPGEMSLHHCNIVHGSNPNRSDEKRIGFIVRFVTNRTDRKNTPFTRVRGSADCRHLDLAGEPAEMDPTKAFELWTDFTRRRQPS
jgi:non-haem Fe2+, alpha-ketoglutarate-dependent halogenase